MTTGSKYVNTYVNDTMWQDYQDYMDGTNNGTFLVGSASSGSLYQKTWNGADSVTPTRNPPGKKRKYTTKVNGKLVTRTFREKPLRRAQNRIPNPYSMESIQEYSPKGRLRIMTYDATYGYPKNESTYYNAPLTWMGGYTTFPILYTPAFTDNDQIALINKLSDNIRGNGFNMSVFLGEGHQTLKMIGDTAITVAKAIRSVRKGDVVNAVNLLFKGKDIRLWKPTGKAGLDGNAVKQRYQRQLNSYVKGSVKNTNQAIAAQWLQLQYGWIPLLSDMKEGAELLSHQLNVPFRQRYSARKKVLDSVIGDQEHNPYELMYFRVRESSYSRQLIAYLSEPPSVATLTGLLDPELVAWELVPFSFVADWVMPIGDYLTARAAVSKLTGTFVTTSLLKQYVASPVGTTNNTLISPGNRFDVTVVEGGSCYYKRAVMYREVSTNLTVPQPQIKPFSKAASWQHCANGLALLIQAASGAKVRF